MSAKSVRATPCVPVALVPLQQAADGEEAEHHRHEREDAEPDHRLEIAESRQPDVAEEVRLLEPVERLARRAQEQLDARSASSRSARAHANRPPLTAVVRSCASAEARSLARVPREAGLGHERRCRRARRASVIAPPAITRGAQRGRPERDRAGRARRTSPRRRPGRRAGRSAPTFSAPTSSVIQASSAPLVNVYESPRAPRARSRARARRRRRPAARSSPSRGSRSTSESRRPYVSATTPVGISKRNTAASIAVPMRTS